jgi:Ca2+-binding EF-hand superfamily protein
MLKHIFTSSLLMFITTASFADDEFVKRLISREIDKECAANQTEPPVTTLSIEESIDSDPYGMSGIAKLLDNIDMNGNGEVSIEEITIVNPSALHYWKKFDKNKDGSITPYELKSHIKIAVLRVWEKQFRSLDRTRDGKFDLNEMRRSYYRAPVDLDVEHIFSSFDLNDDKQVDQVEYIEAQKLKI